MDQNIQQELNHLNEIGGQLDAYIKGGQLPHIQIPEKIAPETKLPLTYTKTQFFTCLLKLIIEVTQDEQRMTTLKLVSKNCNYSFRAQFDAYLWWLKVKNEIQGQDVIRKTNCVISILESMFLKIFQSNDPTFYFQILNSQFINNMQTSRTIQNCDLELIRRIVYSKKVKPLIRQLNQIKHNDQSEENLNQEINDLLLELQKQYCTIKENYYYGLTCLDGQLVFNENIVDYQENQGDFAIIYRAVLIITYIHEVFFHLKRIKYCHMDNVLESTPPKYSPQENNSENQADMPGEAGEFFEYRVFRDVIGINNCSVELANAILIPERWEDDNFLFWKLVKTQYSPNKSDVQLWKKDSQDSQVMSPPSKKIQSFGCPSSLRAGFLGKRLSTMVNQ